MLSPAAMRGHFRVLRRIGPRIVRPLGLGHGVVQTSVRWVARRDWVVTPVVDRGHDSRVQCAFLKLGQKAGPAIGSNHLNGRGDLRGRVTQFAMVHRPLYARGGIVQQTRQRIVGIAAEKSLANSSRSRSPPRIQWIIASVRRRRLAAWQMTAAQARSERGNDPTAP